MIGCNLTNACPSSRLLGFSGDGPTRTLHFTSQTPNFFFPHPGSANGQSPNEKPLLFSALVLRTPERNKSHSPEKDCTYVRLGRIGIGKENSRTCTKRRPDQLDG
jgi:hypothetical protein